MIQKKDVYSVYTHTSPSGKVYVGVSNNPKRRLGTYGAPYLYKTKNGKYGQSCFANAIIKYGWDNFKHEILLKNVSFSEALYAEKYLIRWYKIHNISYNMSDGGEYYSGSRKPLSEERKLEIRKWYETHTHPMKGRHHTEEAKRKMSQAAKNREFTDEQRAVISEKLSKAHKGKHHTLSKESIEKLIRRNKEMYKNGLVSNKRKEIYQYDLNGNYITFYQSVTDAAKTVNRKVGDISRCAKGKILSVGGYIWSYNKVEHIDTLRYIIVGNKLYTEEGYKKKRTSTAKSVNQYSISGEYLTTYNSIVDAINATKASKSGIKGCCSHCLHYNTSGGYRWEYDTIDNRKNLIV